MQRSWIIAVALGAAGALGGFVAGRSTPAVPAEARLVPSAPSSPSATASPALPSASPSAAGAPVREGGLHERARGGELAALKTIEDLPAKDRTIDDALALAAGHRVLLLRELSTLGDDIARDPALARDRTILARLAEHAADPEAAPHALPIVAQLPGEVGPDLLYEVWKESPHPATRSLAEDLLKVNSVRDKASKALEATLDLEAASRCERAYQVLAAVREHGDRRALPRLKELAKKTGCGRDRKDDCWPCLRDDDRIAGAREVLAHRKPPRPWAIRRR